MPLDISRLFNIDPNTYADKGVVVYGFKDELLDEFVSVFLLPFRQAHISNEDLDAGVREGLCSLQRVLAVKDSNGTISICTWMYFKTRKWKCTIGWKC